MKVINKVLYGSVICFALLAYHIPKTKKNTSTSAERFHTTLTLDGKSISHVDVEAGYMVFKGYASMVNVSFRWEPRKDGQVDVFNHMFLINAYGLKEGKYRVAQISQKPGTGGMSYVIIKNDQGDQQDFGVLKKGTLFFSKIDTLQHSCSGECAVTLQDNNSNKTATFTAKWEDISMVKLRMPQ